MNSDEKLLTCVKHRNKKRCFEMVGRIVLHYSLHSFPKHEQCRTEIPYTWRKENEVNNSDHGPKDQAHPSEPWFQDSPTAPGSRTTLDLKLSPWCQGSTDGLQSNPVAPEPSGIRVQVHPNGLLCCTGP